MKKRRYNRLIVYVLAIFLLFFAIPNAVFAADGDEITESEISEEIADSEDDEDEETNVEQNNTEILAEEDDVINEQMSNTLTDESAEESGDTIAMESDEYLSEELTGYGVPLSEDECLSEDLTNPTDLFDATAVPTEKEAYNKMIALKASYPEGMPWTNANGYSWKGGIYSTGYGCAGFAFILSDAAFGTLPSRIIYDFTYDKVHVGDILRVNNNTHSVVIMEKYADHVVLAEGNYNSSIHWGRTMTVEQVEAATYLMTRYPVGTFEQTYSLRLDSNGGSGGTTIVELGKNESYTFTNTVPSKAFHDFIGWSTSKTSQVAQYKVGDKITISQNTVLYAVWKKSQNVSTISATKIPAEYSISISSTDDVKYYSFSPVKSGKYTFESIGGRDPYIALGDSNSTLLAYNDDGGSNFNFKLTYSLEAGKEYYLGISSYEVDTFKMSVTSDVVISPYDDPSFTGLKKDTATGKWYYVKNGQIDYNYVGLAKNVANGHWYYVNKGSISWNFTGLAKNPANGHWYYVTKGEIDWKYTGLAKNAANGNWYYVKNGEIDFKFTGIAKNNANGRYYYVKNGQLDWNYSGKFYDSTLKRTFTVTKGEAR